MTTDIATALAAANNAAPSTIGWRRALSPADVLAGLATACTDLGIDTWDLYDEGGAVTRLEDEVRALLAMPAAAYFPSGVMAQQVALRLHTRRVGSRRVALPDLSHLVSREEDGPRRVTGLQLEYLTHGAQAPTAAHLAALPGTLGAVLVELPLRDAGCLLPTFAELAELSAACRSRGIPFHLDAARLWESQDYLGHTLPEIVALADTVYVSFYKGLGGLAGSMLLGPDEIIAEARLWRRRMGGTTYRNTAEAVSALVGLRHALPILGDCVRWARAFAAALPPAIAVQPGVPHTNQFFVYTPGPTEAINRRLLAAVEQGGAALGGPWRPTPDPGRAMAELNIGDGALGLDAQQLAERFGALVISGE